MLKAGIEPATLRWLDTSVLRSPNWAIWAVIMNGEMFKIYRIVIFIVSELIEHNYWLGRFKVGKNRVLFAKER